MTKISQFFRATTEISTAGFRNNTKICGMLLCGDERAARSLGGNRLVFRGGVEPHCKKINHKTQDTVLKTE